MNTLYNNSLFLYQERNLKKAETFMNYVFDQSTLAGFDIIPKGFAFKCYLEEVDYFKPANIIVLGYNFYIFPFYTGESLYYVCFDIGRISFDDLVELYVPSGLEGIFVGKNGHNLKYWSEYLININKISVKGY